MKLANNRIILWAHLVSEHASILDIDHSTEDLVEMHNNEHEGPATVRNHPPESRDYSLKKLGQVLSESES